MAGRKSKLSPEQWQDAAERVARGESIKTVAELYKIDQAAIRRKLRNLSDLAQRVAATAIAERQNSMKLSNLSEPDKRIVSTLADGLIEISHHLCAGARYSAMSFHKLAQMANLQASKIDDVDPLSDDSSVFARNHAALQDLANKAATVPLGLLKANQETIDDINRNGQAAPEPKQIVFTVQDAHA